MTASRHVAAAALIMTGSQAFVPSQLVVEDAHSISETRVQRLRTNYESQSDLRSTWSASVPVAVTAALLTFATAAKSGQLRRLKKLVRSATTSEPSKQAMSQALPWMPVPAHLTNNPTDVQFPGDVGFDPLGFAADDYVNEVIQNFGFEFDGKRWYRESELMHGRVAMLATFNVILRNSIPGSVPEEEMGTTALWEFVQIMTMLEAFRGYRLFFNTEKIAGDLGYGAGPIIGGFKVMGDMTLQELAEKQYKELQNGRLAMLAFAGIAAQYFVTGRPVGVDVAELLRLEESAMADAGLQGSALTILGAVMAIDGARRLSTTEEKASTNSIAAKALNLSRLAFGVQDPQIPLPAGIVAGQAPAKFTLTEAQIRQFEEDGVIHIPGAVKDWVDFLQASTAFQIDNPHFWSLIGRMSGMYDYIQRNMWMTNNGFRDFVYYSPLSHIVAQLARTDEVRVSTDLLLVNPNKGFGWHQDNQNGPIDFDNAVRWWCAMDRCGQNDYGAPEYLLGSHRNKTVSLEAVFVDPKDGDLPEYAKTLRLIPEPGDLVLWNARTIHRIVAPPDQRWPEGTQRRAIAGTMAKAGTIYRNKGGASAISDLAGHVQKDGELLGGPYFPRIYPTRVPEEEAIRSAGQIIGRSPKKMIDMGINLASNASKYVSFTKVVGKRD